eukprot:3600410-Amphidinium_carterae.1
MRRLVHKPLWLPSDTSNNKAHECLNSFHAHNPVPPGSQSFVVNLRARPALAKVDQLLQRLQYAIEAKNKLNAHATKKHSQEPQQKVPQCRCWRYFSSCAFGVQCVVKGRVATTLLVLCSKDMSHIKGC